MTSNRCTPARLHAFEHNLGYDNPIYVEYGKFAKGVFSEGSDTTQREAADASGK